MLNKPLVNITKPICLGIRATAALACLAFCASAFALSIMRGPSAFVSPNAEWIVRIENAKKVGENAVWFRFEGDAYRPVARARLKNPLVPSFAYVTERGELLTIEPEEVALEAYTNKGEHLRTTVLSEIFTDKEIACVTRTAEGINWLPDWGGVEVRADKNGVQIEDALGGTIIVRMDTGKADVYARRRSEGMQRRGCVP